MRAGVSYATRFSVVLGVVCIFAGMVPAQETGIKHRFLVHDFWLGKVSYVDQFDPARNWSMPWGGGTRDLQLVGQNRLMISCNDGYGVYDLASRAKVGEFHASRANGTLTARRRADGSTWLGANQGSNVCIMVLDTTNGFSRTITIPGLKWLRLMRFTGENTLLLSEWDGATEITLDPALQGGYKILRRFTMPRPRNAFMSTQAADGSYWVAGGYAHGLFNYKPDGTLIREFQANQPAGFANWFYAGFQILGNGHIVIANWNGHGAGDFKEGWKLIEFDASGAVVWHWHVPREIAGSINGVLVLDDLDMQVLDRDEKMVEGDSRVHP